MLVFEPFRVAVYFKVLPFRFFSARNLAIWFSLDQLYLYIFAKFFNALCVDFRSRTFYFL